MASLLDAFVKIFADSKDVDKVLKQTIPKSAEQAGQEASSKFSKAFANVKTNIVTGIGQGLGIALTQIFQQGLSAVGQFVGQSIEAASNLNEELTKSDAIFGESAKEIQAWAETAASSFGQSERAALSAASNFAGMFKSVGVGIAEATKGAQDLTELGSDLASFFNTDVESALQALRSGLSGEAESLKRYNVFLTESRVKQYAFQHGIAESGEELTEQQKILARYGLILQDTTDAQGDFVKTSDGLANTQRTLAAEMENVSAELGKEFLPIALELASWMRDEGIPLIRSIIQLAKDAAAAFEFWGDKLQEFQMLNPFDIDPKAKLKEAIEIAKALGLETGELVDQYIALGGAVEDVVPKQRTFASSMKGSEERIRALGYMADATKDDISAFAKKVDTSGKSMHEARLEAEKLEEQLDDLTDAVFDAARAFGDQAYDADQLRGRMNELENEIAETKTELLELEKIKNPTEEQRDDIVQTRGRLAELREELFGTRIDLAKLDATTLRGLIDEMAALQYKTGILGDKAREVLRLFQQLQFSAGKVTGYTPDPGYNRPPTPTPPPPPPKPTGGGEPGQTYGGGADMPERTQSPTQTTQTPMTWTGYDGGAGTSMAITSEAGAGATQAPTGNTYEYHIHAEGQLKVPDPLAAANLLARFQGQGMLPEDPDA